jgi:hypothetical protein
VPKHFSLILFQISIHHSKSQQRKDHDSAKEIILIADSVIDSDGKIFRKKCSPVGLIINPVGGLSEETKEGLAAIVKS